MWNPNNNSDAENFRWCHVRAIEWASWPFFISQPIVPVALLFFPWWEVALVLFGASILWAFVRRALVVPALAHWGAWFVKLKWLACPVAAYLLISRGQWWLAALALLWPVLMFAMQMPVLSGNEAF